MKRKPSPEALLIAFVVLVVLVGIAMRIFLPDIEPLYTYIRPRE